MINEAVRYLLIYCHLCVSCKIKKKERGKAPIYTVEYSIRFLTPPAGRDASNGREKTILPEVLIRKQTVAITLREAIQEKWRSIMICVKLITANFSPSPDAVIGKVFTFPT